MRSRVLEEVFFLVALKKAEEGRRRKKEGEKERKQERKEGRKKERKKEISIYRERKKKRKINK